MLISELSLSQTVDGINATYFEGQALAAVERRRAALWIAARQGLPGSYAGTFAGFPSERSTGIVLFTGERVASASARHILGEEASRVLRLLRVRDPGVTRALEAADDGLMQCLVRANEDPRKRNPGLYCCGKCSVGLWRNLLAGGLDRHEERLRRGARHLRSVAARALSCLLASCAKGRVPPFVFNAIRTSQTVQSTRLHRTFIQNSLPSQDIARAWPLS
jgi:plasmid stability protein